jgi:phage terminase small subunit
MASKHKVNTAELQKRFVDGLVAGKTQLQAYIDAGYAVEGRSRNSLEVAANRLKNNPKIQRMIAEREKEIQDKRASALAWTRDKAAAQLLWLLSELRKDVDTYGLTSKNINGIMGAIRELNELDGIKAKDQFMLNGNASQTLPVVLKDDLDGE